MKKSVMVLGSMSSLVLGLALNLSGALADDIRLGTPAYGGSGCPGGSASTVLSPDNKSLSILFDNYAAEAGSSNNKTLDRKTCNVAIPVHVPQGFSVSLIGVDYRGFNDLPAGATNDFSVEYFFAGSQGPRDTQRFTGPLSEDYLISHELVATALIWSACGKDVILRSNSSVVVRNPDLSQDAQSSVDSIDLKAGIIYQLQWKRCN